MNQQELDVAAAVARIAQRIVPIDSIERCPTSGATGRVLAEDIVAPFDVPQFANAAMDGYALRAADAAVSAGLRVAGRALAGHPYGEPLAAGETVRIMTGAALPEGADTVVMQENAQVESDRVRFRDVVPGSHVRPRGEHLRRGEVILPRGRRLRSYDVGLAAMAGVAELPVRRCLHVGVLSTGDELHDAPQPLGSSGQYDGNRPLLLASLARAGHRTHDLGIVADRAEALVQALADAVSLRLDAVVSSGGVAQGDADIVRRFPALEFVPLAIRPGRGIACGQVTIGERGAWFFGLPGNSVAAHVMYQLVVAPLLVRLGGGRPEPALTLRLPLALAARTRPGQIDWRRGRLVEREGARAVEPLMQQGSSMLRTLTEAQVLVAIGPQAETPAGALVDVIPLDLLD